MKKRFGFIITLVAMSALLLASCGSAKEALPVSDSVYADYVGTQFSGQDPWGGDLAVTVRSIVDGKMDWTFTDTFDGYTLYREQSATQIQDGVAEYSIEGKDVENDSISFSYQGTMELKDGQILFRFLTGSVKTGSDESGSSSRMAEALKDSGLSNEVVLQKATDESLMTYTVKEGDSIHSIAEEFGITTKELAILNQTVIIETAKAHGHNFDDVIEYAKYLFPGEELKVPKK